MPSHGSEPVPDDSYSANELGQYHSLSSLAVATLGLGLLSPLVFASPLLVVLPLATIAMGLLALSRIGASGGNLSGAGMARWGLALAIVCSVASVAHGKIRNHLYERQASAVARRWLQNISAGQFEAALERMTPEATQKLRPTSVTPQIAQTFDQQLMAAMLSRDPLVEALARLSDRGNMSFDREAVAITFGPSAPQVALSFAATVDVASPLQLAVVVVRSANPNLGPSWHVDSWQVGNE